MSAIPSNKADLRKKLHAISEKITETSTKRTRTYNSHMPSELSKHIYEHTINNFKDKTKREIFNSTTLYRHRSHVDYILHICTEFGQDYLKGNGADYARDIISALNKLITELEAVYREHSSDFSSYYYMGYYRTTRYSISYDLKLFRELSDLLSACHELMSTSRSKASTSAGAGAGASMSMWPDITETGPSGIITDLRIQLARKERLAQQAFARAREFQSSNTTLRASFEQERLKHHGTHAELEETKGIIKQLQIALDKERSNSDYLAAQLGKERLKRDALGTELDEERLLRNALDTELNEERLKVDALAVELDKVSPTITELQSKLETKRDYFHSYREQLESQLEELEEALTEKEDILHDLKEMAELKAAEVSALKSKHTRLVDTLRPLVDTHSDVLANYGCRLFKKALTSESSGVSYIDRGGSDFLSATHNAVLGIAWIGDELNPPPSAPVLAG